MSTPMRKTNIKVIFVMLVFLFVMTVRTFDTRSAEIAATPTFSVASGTYSSIQRVAISTATSGATICYTLDGTTPTANGAGHCANGFVYSAAINVAQNDTVVKAIASKNGYTDSVVASANYDIIGIQGPITHVVTDYTAASSATVVSPIVPHTKGNFIAVFVAGSTAPSSVSDTQSNTYTAVEAATNHGYYGRWFYAFAGATGGNTVTATYASAAINRTVQVLEYSNIQSVSTLDAHVNGSGTPSPTFSTDTARELVLAGWMTNQKGQWIAGTDYTLTPDSSYFDNNTVVRAVEQRITTATLTNTTATIAQNTPSNVNGVWVATFRGTVSAGEAAAPAFSLPGGTYSTSQNVTLTTTLSPSTICYTTDGTDPIVNGTGDGCTSGAPYSGAITVSSSETIKAMAGNGTITSPVVSAAYVIDSGAVITFTTTGATFAPMIVVEGSPTILWTFDTGGTPSTSSSATPSVDFGSAATRTNTLVVTPWSAVKAINVGYKRTSSGTYRIPLLAGQNVSAVSGLVNVAPYLRIWASDNTNTAAAPNNTIASLDFSNFTSLETIENTYDNSLTSIALHNTPNLKRLVTEEDNSLPVIDLSESPLLGEFHDRGSAGNVSQTVAWGTTGKYLWHLCAGARNLVSHLPIEQFPNLQILYINTADQTGILDLNSTRMTDTLQGNGNSYSEVYLSGAYPAGNNGTVQLNGNTLSVLEVADNPGLVSLDVSNNKLSQPEIDKVLRQLDEAGASNGTVNLSGNLGTPSSAGEVYKADLVARGWTVTTGSIAVASPSFYPAAGDYFSAQNVTLASATSGTAICYTTDGTTPAVNGTYDGCTTGTFYTSSLNVPSSKTIKAVAAKSGYAASPVARASYRIQGPVTHVEKTYQSASDTTIVAPMVTHTAGNLIAVFLAGHNNTGALGVTDSQGNTYTTVGSAYPTPASGVITGQWFYAYASSTGNNTVTGSFGNASDYRTIRVLEYANVVPSSPIDINVAGMGGSTPLFTTTSANELVLSAYHVESNVTSCTAAEGYTLESACTTGIVRPVEQRVFSSIQTNAFTSISFTSSTSAAAYANWTVGFKLAVGTDAEAPTFSVTPGSYNTIQNVALNTTTSGATICYTVDGSTPATDGAGNCAGGNTRKYYASANGQIRVSTSTIIKAVATKSGMTDSPTNSARYVITGIQGPITNANTQRIAAAATSVSSPSVTHTKGDLLAAFVVVSADPGVTTVTDTQGNAYTAVGNMAAPQSTLYGQWFYTFASNTGNNVVTANFTNSISNRSIRVLEYSNVDTNLPVDIIANGSHGSTTPFTTTASNELILAGWHVEAGSLTACTAADGYTLLADDYCNLGIGRPVEQRIYSTTQKNAFASMGRTDNSNYFNSGWVVGFKGAYTPTFSPMAGTYGATQGVTISSVPAGATLCYTVDGSDPITDGAGHCLGSTKTYSNAISVSRSQIVRAVATKSGLTDSPVSTGIYTIDSSKAIAFTTTGSSFAPQITVTGTPTIYWEFSDGSTSDSAIPSVAFGSAATRTQYLVVTPWSAVTAINIGYDAGDSGTAPINLIPQQNVSAVAGLSNVAPYLQIWASSHNTAIQSLDFSNFAAMTTMECYDCRLTSINLSGASAIKRLNLESNDLTALDLTDVTSLEDLRATGNEFTHITWPAGGEPNEWHLCAHSETNLNTSIADLSKFPALTQLWIRNDQQTGTLAPISTKLTSIWGQNNQYTGADFSGNFPTGNNATVDIFNNQLSSMDLSDDPGLSYLYAYTNQLTSLDLSGAPGLRELDLHDNLLTALDVSQDTLLQRLDLSGNHLTGAAVDKILSDMDTYDTRNSGYIDLSGTNNAIPSSAGQAHADSLRNKGWVVLTAGNILTFGKAGNGGTGSVAITIDGNAFTTCGSACTVSTVAGNASTTVTLTATADGGSVFTGWSNGCNGSGTCTVTLDTSKSVTATFTTDTPGIHGPITHAETITHADDATSLSAPQVTHTKGNLIVVFVGVHDNIGDITVTDTMGNTYTAAGAAALVGGDISGQWFWAVAKTTGLNIVTAHFNGSYSTIRVLEYYGLNVVSPVDILVSGPGNTSPAFTTTAADEIILAAYHTGSATCSAGAGFTMLPNSFCDSGIARPVEQEIVSSIQNGATATMTGSSSISGSWVVSLKAVPIMSAPVFSPDAGAYAAIQNVTLTADPGATICYTTDGSSDPVSDGAGTCTHGNTYSNFISVGSTTTIKAIASKAGYLDSIIVSATYNINSLSSDATLNNFTISSGALVPTFASATTNYNASVPYAVTSTTITPMTNESHATITVNGVAVASGSASDAIPLNVGSNSITIVVTAQNGVTHKTYTVSVTRAADSAKAITSFNFASPAATGVINEAGHTVSLTVPYGTNVKTLAPVIVHTGASISPASGVAQDFTEPVIYTVTAADSSFQLYTVTVATANASTDCSLAHLAISSGALSPAFASVTENYIANVAYDVSNITVTPTVNESNASVKVNGSVVTSGLASDVIDLSVGSNSIVIVVTAQDGSTQNTYYITIVRAAASSGGAYIYPTAPAPTFSVVSGSYNTIQNVALITRMNSARIYYTIDGSMPTVASLLYTAPINVSSTVTINAIAIKGGYHNSPVASATYNIDTAGSGGSNISSRYPDGTLLRTINSPRIYVMIDVKKKWIPTPEVFEQLGYHWTETKMLTDAELSSLPDYEDNLIRVVGDYKVYLVVNGVKRHIPNSEVFLNYGFRWEDVKDVPQETLDKYQGAYLIKESGKEEVYYLRSDGIRKHIPSVDVFNNYNDRWGDIQIISAYEMANYPLSNLVRLDGGSDIYLLEGNIKRHISNPEVFNRYKFNWNQIIDISQYEFNFYRNGEELF